MNKTLVAAAFVSGVLGSSAAFAEDQPLIERQPHQCGTEQINRTGLDWDPREAPASFTGPREIRTIYLNSKGASYSAGNFATNAPTGKVNGSILGFNTPDTVEIPAISNAFNWPKIATCVKKHFERFNVRIVETKPTSGTFIEAVVGGDGSEIPRGRGGGLLGIAAADNFCGITEGGIAFSFSEAHIGIERQDDELCATIAHEIGHLVTLEHETAPKDVMSYVFIADSQTKAFLDATSTCGTGPQDVMQSCTCGGTMTSSGMKLAQFIGLRPVETTPPTLALESPGDGQVGASFEVVATASDDSGIDNVAVFLNDQQRGVVSEAVDGKYKLMLSGVAEGAYTLRVVATDGANNSAMQERSINVVKLATGETCVANDACKGGICAQSPDGNFCTESCNVAADTCPDGFSCESIGTQAVCVASPDEGGCCSASPNVGAAGMLSLLVGFVLFGRRRRR